MGRGLKFWAISTVAFIFVAGLLLPSFSRGPKVGAYTKNLNYAKQLDIACALYAADHEGRFPLHLTELEPTYLPMGGVDNLRGTVLTDEGKPLDPTPRGSQSPVGIATFNWLYFGAGFDNKNPPPILFASPQVNVVGKRLFHKGEERRIFICGDGSSRIAPEATYQQLLAETIRQTNAREMSHHDLFSPATPSPTGQ